METDMESENEFDEENIVFEKHGPERYFIVSDNYMCFKYIWFYIVLCLLNLTCHVIDLSLLYRPFNV